MNTPNNTNNKKLNALLASLRKANIKMLREKMLRGEEVVIADKDGNIIHADAAKLYEEMTKE